MDSGCALARLTQAKLHRQAGRLAEAEQALRPALTSPDAEWRTRSFYELGAICDRQGRYDDAMSAFLQAKAPLRAFMPPWIIGNRDTLFRYLEEMRNNISADMLARWSDTTQELLQPPRRLALLAAMPAPAPPCWNRCWIRTRTSSRRRKPPFFLMTLILRSSWPAAQRAHAGGTG